MYSRKDLTDFELFIKTLGENNGTKSTLRRVLASSLFFFFT